MKFRHEIAYDAPKERVFEMLADPEFRRRACEAQDVISADVSLERTGAGFSLVIDQLQKTDDLPSFARAFAGDSTQAIQREEWADASSGTLEIEAPGKPTSAKGTITLQADGAGTREVVELEIKVKVPLIGGKLEKLMAEKVSSGMDVEQGVGTAYLAGELTLGKRVDYDLVYDASIPEVYAMLGDQAFRERVCVAIGAIRHTVSIEKSGEGMVVVLDWVQTAEGLPSFATKFVGDEINIVQRETWHGVEGGAVEVTIPGKPGEMSGTVSLQELGGMTTEHVDLEVKVGIPLFGGKIEGLIGGLLIKSLKVENGVGRSYLMG